MLTGSENGFDTPELNIHLRGLRHLAEMVGQETLEEGRYRPMVLLYVLLRTHLLNERLISNSQDYVAAVCTNKRPLLIDTPSVPQLRRTIPPSMNVPAGLCSPLLFCKAPYVAKPHGSPTVKTALEEAFYALETLHFHSHTPHSLLLATFGDRAVSKLEKLQRPTENADVSTRIEQACRITAIIHIRAASRLIPHRDPRNEEDINELYGIVKTLDIHDWKHIPYVLLWV